MSNESRRLCLDYLVSIGGSRAQAKQSYGRLTLAGRESLLRDATAWDERQRQPQGLSGLELPPVRVEHPAQDASSEVPVSDQPKPVKLRSSARQKKVMFSILLPPSDLEALRDLANESGETVAYHVRTAIKRYLKAYEKGDV